MPHDTSILDSYFGPRTTKNDVRQNVYNWRCEDNLRPLLDAYYEYVKQEVGDIDLSPRLRKEWYAAARDLREDLYSYHVPEAEWEKFVGWACRLMKKKDLDNKNLRSLRFLVPRWQKRKREEDTSKYLRWLE